MVVAEVESAVAPAGSALDAGPDACLALSGVGVWPDAAGVVVVVTVGFAWLAVLTGAEDDAKAPPMHLLTPSMTRHPAASTPLEPCHDGDNPEATTMVAPRARKSSARARTVLPRAGRLGSSATPHSSDWETLIGKR